MSKNYDYKKLTPFKWFVLQNFPFIDEDFDAITNWQLFCKLGEEINKVITSTNTMGEQVEELTNYVSTYFDNLNVQDEINNKLDEMAENGELEELITQYLNIKGMLCFNSVSDMKNATNLINGSYVKTFGYYNINDGGSSIYKVRTITNQDTIDEMTIIALNDESLVAEIIYENDEVNILKYGAKNDNSVDITSYINKAISVIKANDYLSTLYIPSGIYKVNSNINDIDFALNIKGSYGLLNNKCTRINDTRNNNLPLIKYVKNESKTQGFKISDIEFYGNDILKDCIYLDDSIGWDFIIDSVAILNYKGTALYLDGTNDGSIINSSILGCSSYDSTNSKIHYAIYDNGNAHHYTNCHFEHCRYFLNLDTESFFNTFVNCKFEHSLSETTAQELSSPIEIKTSYTNTFDACQFVPVSVLGYMYYNENATISNLPYFINDLTNGFLTITNCDLRVGSQGLSEAGEFATPDTLFYAGYNNKKIVNNTFDKLSGIKSPIICGSRSIFSNNHCIESIRHFTNERLSTVTDKLIPMTFSFAIVSDNNLMLHYGDNVSNDDVLYMIDGTQNKISNNIIADTTDCSLIDFTKIPNQYITKMNYKATDIFSNYPINYISMDNLRLFPNMTGTKNSDGSITFAKTGDITGQLIGFAINNYTGNGKYNFKYKATCQLQARVLLSNGNVGYTKDLSVSDKYKICSVNISTSIPVVAIGFSATQFEIGDSITIFEPYIS